MSYHKKFSNFRPETIFRTKHLIDGWKNADEQTRWAKMNLWVMFMSISLEMDGPKVRRSPHAGHGYYKVDTNEIHLSKPSIVTLLHEFRHAMQAQNKAGNWRDLEHDARGWSLSLYYKIAPRTLRKLVREGMVLHIDDADFE